MRSPVLLAIVSTFLGLLLPHANAASPKKLLVVTTTTGFRHSCIPLSEKILTQLAEKSGEFTLDFVDQPPGKPNPPKKVAPLKSDATEAEKTAYAAAQESFKTKQESYETAEKAWDEKLKQALEKLSPESLKNYDGVVFDSTTGDLPIPDKQGFLDWIKAGHAFIGIHSAGDTFHGWPGYIEMLGAEFNRHGAQVGFECIVKDRHHPATANLAATWVIQQEEAYTFKNYDASKVHELLVLDHNANDKTPGNFPMSWCKDYGKGKVFYTALGHREDLWDSDPSIKDRKNSVELSKAFQAHVLGGIEWALGLKPGDATPQK